MLLWVTLSCDGSLLMSLFLTPKDLGHWPGLDQHCWIASFLWRMDWKLFSWRCLWWEDDESDGKQKPESKRWRSAGVGKSHFLIELDFPLSWKQVFCDFLERVATISSPGFWAPSGELLPCGPIPSWKPPSGLSSHWTDLENTPSHCWFCSPRSGGIFLVSLSWWSFTILGLDSQLFYHLCSSSLYQFPFVWKI